MSFGVWHKVRNKKNKEGVSYDPSDVYRLYAEEWNDAHDAFGILCGYAFKFSSTIVTGNASWQELSDVTITLDLPCLLYTSPSPRDLSTSRMPSSA